MELKDRRENSIFKGAKVAAKYHAEQNPLYQHNAFIEALPDLLEPGEVTSRISRYPVFVEEMRAWPGIRRLDQVMMLSHLIVPMPDHFLLEQQLSRVIRNGYMHRNPLKAEWIKQLNAGFEDLFIDDIDNPPVIRANASGFAIIGPSGSGKTTSIESILGLYPQVIIHTKFNGTDFPHQQLVWLKLECPSDGSTKALCNAFFEAVDQILGTEYLKKYGSGKSKEEMMPKMAHVAWLHGIGVLVIDELQRLNAAASGGVEKMMNFFTLLNNSIGVPVVLVGTAAALHIISDKFSQARRSSGQGDGIWSPMAHDATWDYFLEKLWRYQLTNEPTKLTDELNVEMYIATCGIPDLAVKLYMLMQWRVIGRPNKGTKESLTQKIIRQVAKDCFKFMQPALRQLKSGNIDDAKYLDDLLPSQGLLAEHLKKAQEKLALGELLKTVTNERENEKKDGHDPLLLKLTAMLSMAGHSDQISEESARRALDRHAEELDFTVVSQEAMLIANELKAEKDAKKQRQKQNKNGRQNKPDTYEPLSEDLRRIIKDGEGNSAYEKLQNAGVIKPAGEFLYENGVAS